MENLEVPCKRRKIGPLTVNEKTLIFNCFKSFTDKRLCESVDETVKLVSSTLGVGKSTIYRVIKEEKCGSFQMPRNAPGKPKFQIEYHFKEGLRRKVHEFFFRQEFPTLDKVLVSVRDDKDYPEMSRSTLWKLLKEIGFRWKKNPRKSILLERSDIVIWRRHFLRTIKEMRNQKRKIFYLDETWINEGHTPNKFWQDETVTSQRHAFVNNLSTGLNPPSGKGRRLIIVHIGSSDGFVEGGLLTFESTRTGDYHEDMNADVFQEWFEQMIDLLPKNCVIVMDNASYHSRLIEGLPTTKWLKKDLQNWLSSKNITYHPGSIRKELYSLCALHKEKFKKYEIDEIAKNRGMTVLRSPPYHCELNPIELVWAQIKSEVSRKNTTFKIHDVKQLFLEAVNNVKPENWEKAVNHTIKEEEKMWKLDNITDKMIEPVIINLGSESSSSESDLDL
ncbi:uncharacterized protein [Diabrotica undecimpunctata]|uniref:uncharacterized protein n=1 Tax=Diabrotica undecimpunctata TaxID=50387 RepID=UPI003B632228